MNFDSIKAELGKNDTTGDPNDQPELTNRKVARAVSLMVPAKDQLGNMLKAAAVAKVRSKKRKH